MPEMLQNLEFAGEGGMETQDAGNRKADQGEMNLVEGLIKQMNRNRELVKQYESCGTAGVFGAAMISADIRYAENTLASGDMVEMLKAYKKLEENV
jgi:hypothetical protein